MRFFQYRENYLSAQTTASLKGICAIVVLIHHLYQNNYQYVPNVLGGLLQYMGVFAVTVFFFLSGYGVMYCYRNKEQYLHKFPIKKILPFYALILFLNGFYFIVSFISHEPAAIRSLLQSFVFRDILISNGWYLYVQLFLYVGFYVCFRYFSANYQLFSILVYVLALMGVTYTMGLSSYWYQNDLMFVFWYCVVYVSITHRSIS